MLLTTPMEARPEIVDIGPARLEGELALPPRPQGLVLFAHGSGSTRHSPRNARVAAQLQAHGLGTLRFDLLQTAEAAERDRVFDIDRLAQRLVQAIHWADSRPTLARLPLGLFGASTGAAAALRAAAAEPDRVGAVVSRGGRPDLAGRALERVRAPTLLIVGGRDLDVLALNQEAQRHLHAESRLSIVPGATHLFEEPGALEHVAHLASDWFITHLSTPFHGADHAHPETAFRPHAA